MSDNGFDDNMHRFLDGHADAALRNQDREVAERFGQLVNRYSDELDVPGAEIDRVVMTRIRQERAHQPWLSWLFSPQQFTLRPVGAVIVLALVVVGTRFVVPARVDETAAADGGVAATVLVRFELEAPGATEVAVSGSFNAWDATGAALVKHDGVWSITVPLAPGQYEYGFVVDGNQWRPDPRAHAQVDDGFGQFNSVIAVGPRGVIRS